ncbi:MAG: hypothetical protein ACPG8W_14470 [Candidatus Promineifilaceae bacterium]
MQSDDRVLVAYVKNSADFDLIKQERWYRIPVRHAPKGIHAEWIAFYFGKRFGADKYAVHYVARNSGHELATRLQLFPNEPNHPRANDWYFKMQLSELRRLDRPIVSLSWRRVLFIHTTGDRFQHARELRDLLINGDDFSHRAEITLRETVTTPYVIQRE